MPRFDPERSKRRTRRLVIIAAILVAITGAGAVLYAVNSSSRDQEMTLQIEQSRVAFEQGDYAKVIELLEDRQSSTNTIRAIQRDPAALYRYVKAREQVPMTDGEHFALLFPALRQVVALEPANLEAGEMLLGLQLAFDRVSDALATATRLIEVHRENPGLLQYRASIYERMGRKRDALKDIWAALALKPLDFRASADAARFSMELGSEEPERFDNWSAQVLADHPDDPRALLIRAQAQFMLSDLLQTEQYLIKAAELDPTDQDAAQAMVQWLEMIDRFDLSSAYLTKHADPGFTNQLGEELIYRSYEQGDDAQVVERFNQGDAKLAATDLTAVVVLSARQIGDEVLETRLLAKLRQSPDDYPKTWAAVLDTLDDESATPGELIAALSDALKLRPDNPHLSFILGRTLMDNGEFEAAAPHLNTAARVRSAWARPRYLAAQIALRFGETRVAAEQAQAAVRREPRVAYADLEAAARAYDTDASDADALDRAIRRVQNVQTQAPGSPRSLLALIDLYRRAGMGDKARETVTLALALNPPLDQATLAELARQADILDPALAQQARDQLSTLYGENPQVALDRAVALADLGKIDQGLDTIRANTPDPADRDWLMALAQYLSYIGSPDAAGAWIDLADRYPNDLRAQTLAANEVPLAEHRAFAERAITRMREQGGEQSVGWRIARARLMLTAEASPGQTTVEQADTLLQEALAIAPNRADTHRLLSRVHELKRNPDAAIQAMQRALSLQPDNMPAQYRLGVMLHEQRRYREAKQSLFRVAGSPDAELGVRMNALTLLARQGELGLLIPIAQALTQGKLGGVRAQVLLTELYLADGRIDDAQRMADTMLQSPTAESVAYLAEFFDRTGQPDRAERTVALLDTLEIPQSDRSEILALFSARRDDTEAALAHFRAAAQAAPSDTARWITLVSMDLLFVQPQAALSDAQSARMAGINDPGIVKILEHRDLISTLAVDQRFSRLTAAILTDPAHRQAAITSLTTIKQAAEQRQPLLEVARTLAEQAEQHPDFLPLQILSAQLLLQAGAPAEAAEAAVATMQRFPTDAQSARLSALALSASADWRRTTTAAVNWGRRAPEYRGYADLLLATAQRNLDRYDDAMATLDPYLLAAQADPETGFPVLREYAWALAQRGQTDRAWQMIQPHLASAAQWRQLAAGIAGQTAPTAQAATSWFNAIASAIPTDNTGERLVLAQERFNTATRLNDDALLDQARVGIEQILQSAAPPAEALYLRGRIAETTGDLRLAEDTYRQLLRQSPQAHSAMNNLAMVLLHRGRDLDQALRFAIDATRTQPTEANYFDTLAQVYAARKDYPQALATIERAIQLQPSDPTWHLTKADILDASGDKPAANILRERYQARP